MSETFLYDDGEWMRFPRALLPAFGIDAAMMLAVILNQHTLRGNRHGEWTRVRIKDVEHYTGMNEDKQKRILKQLKADGIIEVAMQGQFARRHIRVDIEAIHRRVQKRTEGANLHGGRVQKRTGKYSKNITKEEDTGVSGFFAEAPKTFGHDCTKLLHQALHDNRMYSVTSKPQKWPVIFNRLAAEVGEKTVWRVLSWYCEHGMKWKYCKKPASAKEFMEVFHRIRESRKRWKEENAMVEVQQDLSPDDLTKKERRIYDNISDTCSWPKGSRRQLPGLVRASLANYEPVHAAMTALDEKLYGKETPLAHFIAEGSGIENLFGSNGEVSYLTTFLEGVSKRIENWEGWSGSLKTEAWSLDNKQWNKAGYALAQDFGNTELWDKLKQRLTE